jgi:co-chaperonin GroES (HSP10)
MSVQISELITEKEKKHFDIALEAVPPIEALINRVLVTQIREEDEKVENISIPGFETSTYVKVGSIAMPRSSKEKLKDENETVLALVKSVGPRSDGSTPSVQVGDLVFVFPSVFETKFTFDGVDYFSYGERDLVAKAVR